MAGSVTQEVDQIFRHAVACRVCFRAPLHLHPALIDVAQPRWIGEHYWDGLGPSYCWVNPERAGASTIKRTRTFVV